MLAIVASVAVPLLALLIVMFGQLVAANRQQVRAGLLDTARSLAAAVDNEIDTPTAIAATLAATQMLRTGDYEGFIAHSRRALETMPGSWIALADTTPRLIASTLSEASSPELPPAYLEVIDKARSEMKPRLSNIINGPIASGWHAILAYPVLLGGEHRFTIIVGLPPQGFLSLLRDKVGSTTAVAIIDRNANFVARIPNFETTIGKPAAEGWRKALKRSSTGLHDSSTVEGVPSLQAYAQTRDGWNVGIAAFLSDIEGPVRRVWWLFGSLAAAVAAIGVALGMSAARGFSRSLVHLSNVAEQVGRGKIVAPEQHAITEMAAIDEALSKASLELATRTEALRDSEAKFRFTFENTAVGMANITMEGVFNEVNQRLCEMLGYSEAELRAMNFRQVTHPDDLAADLANQERLMTGEVSSFTMDKRFIRKNGQSLWTGLTVSLRRDHRGAPLYFIKVIRDVTQRKNAEAHQQFLQRELVHRSNNQLAVIRAIARQTAQNSSSLAVFEQKFNERIEALAVSTRLMVEQNWNGAPLSNVVLRHVEAFRPDPSRLAMDNPPVTVDAVAAEALGLAFHELATNSVKYGAWSSPGGLVTVAWRCIDAGGQRALEIEWIESNGPPVTPPSRTGFGHIVMKRMVAAKLDGTVDMTFPATGLRWTLKLPAAHFDQTSS